MSGITSATSPKGSTTRLHAVWNWLAPPAWPLERKASLTRTLQICSWVTLLVSIPPCIGIARLGDYRCLRALLLQELCLLVALWLSRRNKAAWAARLGATGVLASATLMVTGSPDGFHGLALLMLP